MITAQARIDLNALQHNYRQLKSLSGSQKVVAVIKGDAYGHGAVQLAQALPEADLFAVSRLEEAEELRQAGINQPILLLEGCFCGEDLQRAAEMNLATTIHCEEQLCDLENRELANPVNVWLKVDTGMHRLGVQPYEVSDYVARIERTQKLKDKVGFISHFSCADDINHPTTQRQLACFNEATAQYDGPKTIANSAGILFWPQSQYDVARAGIALFGISPSAAHTGSDHTLIPVMTLTTRLIAVRKHQASRPVGYGETWLAERDTNIGVIAMGYGDGYPRCAPSGTPVYVNGRQVPIVGRVSMDMITVDLGPDAQDKVGDEVELWGQNLPIETIANHVGTIPYELTIKLTPRVNRCYSDNQQ
ncbi:alanine racemase [Vibrio fluvialis]|nr:alanine racemase [Vibrio fluvialis]